MAQAVTQRPLLQEPHVGRRLCYHCLEILNNFEHKASQFDFVLAPATRVVGPETEEDDLQTKVMHNSLKEFYINKIRKLEPEEEEGSRESF